MATEPPRSSSATGRLPAVWLVLGAVLAAFVGFGRLLPAYFVGDDFAFIGRYATFPFAEWPGLFTRTWQAGLFAIDLREIRPLTALAFMVDARLWGAEPFGFRLTNLLLHAGCIALVGAIAWQFSRARLVAASAALLFAFHPVTVPAVGWITGRVDVLSTLFLLGAAFAWLRCREDDSRTGALFALGLCLAGGLFTKESALVFPALALLLDFSLGHGRPRWREARAWRPYLVLAVVLALYLVCRLVAFGNAGPSGIGRGLPSLTRALFYTESARRQAGYLANLLPPAAEWLPTWSNRGFPLAGAVFLRVVAITLAGAIVVALFVHWFFRTASPEMRRRALCLGAGWYLATTLPLIVTYYSPRHLYLTWAGLAVIATLIAHDLLRSPARFAAVAFAGVAALAALHQPLVGSWLDAGTRSREFSRAVQAAARDAEPGAFVFIDAPDYVDGAFCWSWAVPHCLRPPFTPAPLDARIVPIAQPAAYAFRENWRAHLPLAALAANAHAAHLLRSRSTHVVGDGVIAADQVRRAALVLAQSRTDDDTAWLLFVRSLRAQPAAP